MINAGAKEPGIKKVKSVGRQAFSQSQQGLVKMGWLQSEKNLPLVIQPAVMDLDLVSWAARNREFIDNHLWKYGGMLFRGFNVGSVGEFERFITTISGDLVDYSYRSTPRTRVSGKIFTSTEYPADQSIPLHNEASYSKESPMKIWFYCVEPSAERGETPIADSRAVFEGIEPKIKQQFIEKKVMYIRNYGAGLDLPWQTVFQTSIKATVEDYCRQAGIEFEWRNGDSLRTREIRQAVARHPRTGEMVWFNQAHLFHVSNLKPEIRESLLALFSEEDLPRNACYGDGTPIDTSVLAEIRQIYEDETVLFRWQEGDVLMLDNILAAHGRTPFTGSRKILVGMAEAFTNTFN
jgi:alpha-ketoglutarate-dependent taurine dioxygenase